MTIEFRCGQCNQLLRVPDHSAGKNARCPKCQALMQVPAPVSSPVGQAMPSPPPFPGPGSGGLTAHGPAPTFVPPPPPPPKTDDPFAFLKHADAGGPPPPNPPANVFGDEFGAPAAAPALGAAAGPPPGVNPYAAPGGGYAGAYAGAVPFYGPRTGLPWEVRPQSFSSWWETMSMIVGSPSIAYSRMRQIGGLGGPIVFAIWGLGVPFALLMCILVPLGILFGVGVGQEGGAGAGLGVGAGMIGMFVLGAIFYVVFAATVGALIGAAVYHLCLLLVGGARQPFETTFRVFSFTQGAMVPVGVALIFIPYIGGLIHVVWVIALLIIGLARAHEIPTGKAALAVLLPFGVSMACCLGAMFLTILGGLASN